MELISEVGIAQLFKVGEQLCGDTVNVIRKEDYTVVVLSDGLGSGVKANILSRLTATIASKMISAGVEIDEIVHSLTGTLPVCQVRGVAYSTFTIVRLYKDGLVRVTDFDGCPVIRISRRGVVESLKRTGENINGRIINSASFHMEPEETLVITSDGVIQAGLGTMLPNGLGEDGLIDLLKRFVDLTDSPQDIADKIVSMCESFYLQHPDDDTTAVVMRLTRERRVVLFTGPPADPAQDHEVIMRFTDLPGHKIICGGTTAQIYSRVMKRQIHLGRMNVNSSIPPSAHIEGVDLVTEGIITLSAVHRMLQNKEDLDGDDPASEVARMLMHAHRIVILQGMSINPAYKGDKEIDIDLREVVVRKLVDILQENDKIVEVETY